jgi:hypothetical protein
MLSGCVATTRPPPPDVSIIPNDCANRVRIIRWLEQQYEVVPYVQTKSQIKHRIWSLRYTCQPV